MYYELDCPLLAYQGYILALLTLTVDKLFGTVVTPNDQHWELPHLSFILLKNIFKKCSANA